MLFEPVRHPSSYGFYIGLGCVDVILTWSLLGAGGAELNALADWAFSQAGITGGAMLKFTTVMVFLLICELVSRHRPKVGLVLARLAVAAAVLPVVVGMGVLVQMLELGVSVSVRFW